MEPKKKLFFQHKIFEGATGTKGEENNFQGKQSGKSFVQIEDSSIAGCFDQNNFQTVSISEGHNGYIIETREENLAGGNNSFIINSESTDTYEWFNAGVKQINSNVRGSSFPANMEGELFNFCSSMFQPLLNNDENPNAVITKKENQTNSSEKTNEEIRLAFVQSEIDIKKENLLLKKTLQQLQKENEELVELNRSKNGLLSIISHDLKNPFGALLNMSEFLATETDDMERTEIGEFAQAINFSAKILYKFFNDLLEWSKLQNGIVNVNPITLDVRAVVENIFTLLNITAMSKGVSLVNKIPQETKLNGDLNMVTSIINNLVTNAIKFTNAGGSVIVQAQELDGFVELAVVDDGVGMGENVLEKIFKLNKHITNNGTENEGGSGLGLVITKDLINRHGGKIWVKSRKGSGTSFHFTLPKENIFAEVA